MVVLETKCRDGPMDSAVTAVSDHLLGNRTRTLTSGESCLSHEETLQSSRPEMALLASRKTQAMPRKQMALPWKTALVRRRPLRPACPGLCFFYCTAGACRASRGDRLPRRSWPSCQGAPSLQLIFVGTAALWPCPKRYVQRSHGGFMLIALALALAFAFALAFLGSRSFVRAGSGCPHSNSKMFIPLIGRIVFGFSCWQSCCTERRPTRSAFNNPTSEIHSQLVVRKDCVG
jgi:hypothetical protein